MKIWSDSTVGTDHDDIMFHKPRIFVLIVIASNVCWSQVHICPKLGLPFITIIIIHSIATSDQIYSQFIFMWLYLIVKLNDQNVKKYDFKI